MKDITLKIQICTCQVLVFTNIPNGFRAAISLDASVQAQQNPIGKNGV